MARPAISIHELTPGTRVRHRNGTDTLLVTSNFGDRAIAVRTQSIMNPKEWLILEEKS